MERSTDVLPPSDIMGDIVARLARLRVTLGFVGGAVVLWFAHPTWATLAAGALIAMAGEGIRVWAAGHLEKGREVTMSGPYRLTGHPLYLGSSIIGAGIAVASASLVVAVITVTYLVVAIGAAIRNEEAGLRAKFGQTYTDYRSGVGAGSDRPFSFERVMRNREYRAVVGVGMAMILLVLKTWLLI